MRFLLALALLAPAASAQHGGHDAHAGHDHDSAAHDTRVPTGLTADETAGLLAGRGLGMARPAELHGYPGPMHVLEHADALGLSDGQRDEAERLRAAMLAQAVPLGRQLVDAERSLDAVFASGAATAADVDRAVAQAAAVRARLRAAHLHAHLGMRAALTPAQVETYDRLQGR